METQRCSATGCQRPVAALFQGRPFCREHFIAQCYEQLEGCSPRLQERPFRAADAESLAGVISECMRQAAHLSQSAQGLDNLERAQLLDILLWAGDVGQRLRRGSRQAACVPIRLRSEKPGRPWEEETETRTLSRHGAMVVCEHDVETDENLYVTRLDTGQQTQARVVWQRRKEPARLEIGLAFPVTDNFWNMKA